MLTLCILCPSRRVMLPVNPNPAQGSSSSHRLSSSGRRNSNSSPRWFTKYREFNVVFYGPRLGCSGHWKKIIYYFHNLVLTQRKRKFKFQLIPGPILAKTAFFWSDVWRYHLRMVSLIVVVVDCLNFSWWRRGGCRICMWVGVSCEHCFISKQAKVK